jgi:hypothetical protein
MFQKTSLSRQGRGVESNTRSPPENQNCRAVEESDLGG